MKKILLHQNATTGDTGTLATGGIYTMEHDVYNENGRKTFEYYALCRNDFEVDLVMKLNSDIAMREAK